MVMIQGHDMASMEEQQRSTLLFLIKRSNGTIDHICLAMKKRGFGAGRWNGVGGKVDVEESIEDAVRRETQEEVNVFPHHIHEVAVLKFSFKYSSNWNQVVHVYFSEHWSGVPSESEEMNPRWFSISEIPYNKMWPDDLYWLPKVISGNRIHGSFCFGKNDTILEKKIELVNKI